LKLSDPDHVRAQYADASRLDARVRIYALYAQREQGLHAWVFDRLDLPADARVLEVGTGTGNLWRENADRIPPGWRITLSDASAPMLDEACERLPAGRFRFAHLDAQRIPFADGRFDAVVANHMLYHVPDRARALAELRRVLVADGRVFATTNGWSHLFELRRLAQRFAVDSAISDASSVGFDLETAAREFEAMFRNTRVESYRDALHVTKADPLVDALRSTLDRPGSAEHALAAVRDHVAWWISVEGKFHVHTWAGLVTGYR